MAITVHENVDGSPLTQRPAGRLLARLNEKRRLTVGELCKKVKADADAFVGESDRHGETTMPCVRPEPPESGAVLTVEPTKASAARVLGFLEGELERLELPSRTVNRLMVAMDEIYSNIVRYSGAKRAHVRCAEEKGVLTLTIRDDGTPYNPLEAKEPDVTACAEGREIGGLGIFMVRKMMDSVDYKYEDGHNILTLGLHLAGRC